MKLILGLSLLFCNAPWAFGQTIIDVETPPFVQSYHSVVGRIQHVTLEQILPNSAKEVVIYTRKGSFPNWKGTLTIFSKNKRGSSIQEHSKVELPDYVIYYGFVTLEDQPFMIWVSSSVMQLVPLEKEGWQVKKVKSFPIGRLTQPWAKSAAVPFSPVHQVGKETQVWIPTQDGYKLYVIQGKTLVPKHTIALYPKSFYRTSSDLLPFEMAFWYRNVYWYPEVFVGSLDNQNTVLISPWMDEMDIIKPEPNAEIQKHYFGLLNEKQRDNRTHYVLNDPVDLNGDGRTDFLLNEFHGTGINVESRSFYYLTDASGKIPSKGKEIPFPSKKISGALVRDISQNGKQDFVIASSALNVWSMIRALTKNQIEVRFEMFMLGDDQDDYDFETPDVVREILFDFSLGDFFIDGILPTLEGDYNGDGYPDVMYATNPREMTFLIQEPNAKERFSMVPTDLFEVKIKPKYRVGDITGDGLSDFVFFSTRAGENEAFTMLVNNGTF